MIYYLSFYTIAATVQRSQSSPSTIGNIPPSAAEGLDPGLQSSPPSKQEDVNPELSRELEDMQPDVFSEVSMPVDDEEKDPGATFTIWDFGGQYVYYTSHQTFLSNRAIYLLTLDMSKPLDESPRRKVA